MSTGLRAGTNNDGYLQVNGTDVLTALSSGSIGIGTNNPNGKFHIDGGTASSQIVVSRFSGSASGASGGVINVLTSNSQSGAELQAYSLSTDNASFLNSINDAVILRSSSTTSGGFALLTANSTAPLIFATDSTERLRISPTGNVGIGTTNPITKLDTRGALHVGGGSNGIWLGNVGDNSAYDNVSLYYTGYNSGSPRIYLTPRTQPGSGTINTYLHLLSSTGVGSNNMGLIVDGNLGVGDNPLTKFFVKQGSSSMGFAEYNNGATIWLDGADGDISGGDYFNISANNSQQLTFGYGGGTSLVMSTDGKLGFSGTSPSFMLDVPRSGATSVDTIRSSATTSGANNRLLFASVANSGGSPYIKFDAGGTDMIVGEKYNGTTANILYLGPGTDIDNGYTSSGGIYVKGDGYVGINYNQSTTKQQLTVNGAYGIYRGNGNGSVWTTQGGSGTFTTLTIEVYQRDYGSFTFDLKATGYNNTHFYAVGGGYMNGATPIGGNITPVGYTNNIVSYTLGGGSQPVQSWKITITANTNQFVHPSCEFHVSVGGQAYINSSDISITWS